MIVYDMKVAPVVHPNQPMAQETLLIAANPLGIKLPPTQDELPSDDGILFPWKPSDTDCKCSY